MPAPLRPAIKDNQLQEVPDSEVEYEHLSPNQHLGTHANLVPLQSAVSSGRVFYGARFANQALPLKTPEAPLVQLLSDTDPEGRSFDEILGNEAGNVRATHEGRVHSVTPDEIVVKTKDGEMVKHDTYENFPFNRKTTLTHIPLVKAGDPVTPGQLLAHSNYTDKNGTLAMGTNARVGIVPYKGHSMDDAIVISTSMAKRFTANNLYGHDLSYKRGVKGGKAHYTGLFTHKFVNEQLDKLDDDGVVKVGQVLKQGDPLILATRPRVVSSTTAQLGQLSKHMKNARNDASVLWDHETPGTVLDVHRTRSGVKVNVSSDAPAEVGDKIVGRSGAKATVSTIVPDEHMPRTVDGKPLEILLNPQSLVSRMNPSLAYEIMLGKVARKTGKTYKLPSVLPKGQAWYDFVKGELDKAGVSDKEEVFDPLLNRKLENPITVGDMHWLKLHHSSESKVSSRGTGSYNADQQPSHGGGDMAQSKRMSGLDSNALMSSGAYNLLREGATLRGTKCFDVQTEVLTRRGWLFWKDVTGSDELYTQDGSGRGFFEVPQLLHRYQYTGDMYGFEGRFLDWLVTPDHKLWMQHIKATKGPKMRFKTAKELHGRTFYIPQFGSVYPGTLSDDYRVPIVSQPGWRSKGFSIPIHDYCELLGWWLSEGCSMIDTDAGKRGYTQISQSESANPKKLETIISLVERIGLKYNHLRCGGYSRGIRIRNKPLAAHLRQYGTGAANKRILPIIFEAPLAARLKLIDAYILGDGHTHVHNNTTSRRASSVSRGLLDDMQRLAVLSGNGGIISLIDRSRVTTSALRDGRPLNCLPIWYIGFADNRRNATVDGWHPSPNMRHAYIEHYDGTVYCATMSTGLLYVRRNGKPMWSGNCDNYWRELRQGHEPKEPGTPFIWEKFKALLQGAGYHARRLGNGKERLQFLTEKDLEKHKPIRVRTGDLVDMNDLSPVKGGLFDPALTGAGAWGFVQLPHSIPNPAAQDVVCKLLGLTERQYRAVLAGEEDMPDNSK